MDITKQFSSLKLVIFGSLLLSLPLLTFVTQAQQPKPGPEQKKLEMLLGEWAYEGTGEDIPFMAAAGKFKGKYTAKKVLGGFFVQTLGEDTSDNQYVYQQVSLTGYDPVKKVYFSHSFENDGTVSVSTVSVDGNKWTMMGTRTDNKGKVYKMRTVDTYSADGKTSKSVTDYSADDGKTWHKAWVSTATKVGN
jgi:hypothetical protein